MKKMFLAITMLILGSVFAFGQGLGEDEKEAVRDFFEYGHYIEYWNSSGQYVIKNQENIVGIRESKDKKNAIEIIDSNGDVDVVSWGEISNDYDWNLIVRPNSKMAKQVLGDAWGGSKSKEPGDEKVLSICSMNEEFLFLIQNYYPDYDAKTNKIGDVRLNYTVIPSYEYYDNLSYILDYQNGDSSSKQIDIFLVEPEYVKKFAASSYSLDLKGDLGFTDEDFAEQFQYTRDLGTYDGQVKAVAWQCNPSGIIYRRSIAKSVFGTDDPDEIQSILSDWEKFNEAAKKLKEKGYYIVSGYEDTFRAFYDSVKTPWVIDGQINIDDSILSWISQQKDFADKGYSRGYEMWSEEFFTGMMDDGKVFCYLGPNWFINYVMKSYTISEYYDYNTYGDWGFCKGPQGFNWGGSWIFAARGSDNLPLVKDILEKFTTDKKVMAEIAESENEFVNNETVMTELAKYAVFQNPLLGDQSNIGALIDSAKSIDYSMAGYYDYDLSLILKSVMRDYFEGYIDEETAWENFFDFAEEMFPYLGDGE